MNLNTSEHIASCPVAATRSVSTESTALKIVVYTPQSPLRQPVVLFRSMWHDLLAGRELGWRMFQRNLSALYRQTVLGYLWLLLAPLATSLTFIVLRSSGVFKMGETSIPYPAYVMIGTLLWQGFVDALNGPLKIVTSSKNILMKLNIPKEALILASFYEVMFNLAVRCVLLALVMATFRMVPPPTALLFPLGLLLLVVLGMSLGLLLVPVGMLYGDVQRAVLVVTGFWMFLTPVVYPPPNRWPAALITEWNPVSPMLLTCREMLTTGELVHLNNALLVGLSAACLFVVAWVLYRLAMPILVERMGN
jgi:lipopolysaccharide transport system permease protein